MNLSRLLKGKTDMTAIARTFLVFLVGLQIFFNPFPQITAVHEFGFYLSALILGILIGMKKARSPLSTPLSIPMGLFALWTLLGLPFALNQGNSAHDIYAHLIKYLALYFLVVHAFSTKRRLVILTWLVTVSSFFFALGTMIHYYLILGRHFHERLGLMSYSEMPTNIIATITVFAALLSAGHLSEEGSRSRKTVAVLFLAVFALTTLATGSKGALIALVIGLLCLFSHDRKRLLAVAAIVVLVIGGLLTTGYFRPMAERLREDPRIGVWYSFVEMAKNHPVAGIGFGMQTYDDDALVRKYHQRVPAAYRAPEPIRAPHNLLVDIAVRTGFVGLALFALIVLSYLRTTRKLLQTRGSALIRHWGRCALAAFIALFIQGMLENIASGPPAVIMYLIFAMAVILRRLDDTPAVSGPARRIPDGDGCTGGGMSP